MSSKQTEYAYNHLHSDYDYIWNKKDTSFLSHPNKDIVFPINEMEALQQLYNSLNGKNWLWRNTTKSGNIWNFTGHHNPCFEKWQGLSCTCARTQKYHELSHLNYNSNQNIYYTYYYDDQQSLLTCNIEKIYLILMNLTGTLSSCTKLSNLEYLNHINLSGNQFGCLIPNDINFFPKSVEKLDFCRSGLYGISLSIFAC